MYKCDFCGKTQDKVKRMIAGKAGRCICGDCVIISMNALIDTVCNEFKMMNIDFENKQMKDGASETDNIFCGNSLTRQ